MPPPPTCLVIRWVDLKVTQIAELEDLEGESL
jgi:hypothetical protein